MHVINFMWAGVCDCHDGLKGEGGAAVTGIEEYPAFDIAAERDCSIPSTHNSTIILASRGSVQFGTLGIFNTASSLYYMLTKDA